MSNNKVKYFTDVILFISIFVITITGFIMAFLTNSGPSVSEKSKYFLNLHRHQWGNIHLIFSILLVTFVVIHLILEWNWIKNQTKTILKSKWNLIVILLISCLAIILGWAFTEKTNPDFSNYGIGKTNISNLKNSKKKEFNSKITRDHNQLEELTYVNGRTTLNKISEHTGIPVKTLISKLNLPHEINPDEKLGRLKKDYGFSMDQLKAIILKITKQN